MSAPRGKVVSSPSRGTWPWRLSQTASSRLCDHRPQTIINTHYTGTISLLACLVPLRFFHRLGATEVTPDTICLMAGVVALNYVYGTALDGFDPRTARDAACIVVWGANPSASGPHAHEHWLREAPGRVVVIDPIRTPTAQAADLHLQPFPGSDALSLCSLHVLWRDGLIDSDLSRRIPSAGRS